MSWSGERLPRAARARYAVGAGVELVPLPYYRRLSEPWTVLRSSIQSLARFWRALRGVDGVWLLGPHPLAIAFAALAAVRRKRVVLGVRQDTRAYVESRHPGRRSLRLAAAALDAAWRALARRFPVVVVGPEIAAHYAARTELLEITVSLVDASATWCPREVALGRSYEGELRVISVGRLETEKNPLLLADVLARLRRGRRSLAAGRLRRGRDAGGARGSPRRAGGGRASRALGYVPYGPELLDLYRESHVLLHVSWTEGFPQVLVEAFAAGLPVVATDVGGVAAAVGEAVRLVPRRGCRGRGVGARAIAADRALREGLVRAGHEHAAARTATAEVKRVADFVRGACRPSGVVPPPAGDAKKLTSRSFANAAIRWAALYSGWQAVSTSRS